jgi:hypothetical protein
MKQTIALTPQAFNCLLRNAPEASVARDVLTEAANSNEPETSAYAVEISCTDEERAALIHIAKEHCPDALQQLEGIPPDWRP